MTDNVLALLFPCTILKVFPIVQGACIPVYSGSPMACIGALQWFSNSLQYILNRLTKKIDLSIAAEL